MGKTAFCLLMPGHTPHTVPTSADFYIKDLPGLSPSSKLRLYAGHLPAYDVSDTSVDEDPTLFFLLARAKHIPDKPRLVQWYNGGPGW